MLLNFFLFGLLPLFFLLVFYGLIGPERLRRIMQKVDRWLFYDSSLFFPIDPYKPLSAALKESAKEALPTRKRFRNWLFLQLGWVVIFAIVMIIAFISVARSHTKSRQNSANVTGSVQTPKDN